MTRDHFFEIITKENIINRIEEDVSRSSHLPIGAYCYGCVFDHEKWRVCVTNERRGASFIKDFNNESDALMFLLEALREEAALEDTRSSYEENESS